MSLILKETSISARLYKWYWNTDKLPDNLCNYFWALVIAYIGFIPCVLLTLPALIVDWYYDKKIYRNVFDENFGLSFGCYLVLFLIICIPFGVYGLFHLAPKQPIMQMVGIIEIIMIIFFTFIWLFRKAFDYILKSKIPKENKPNLVVEYFKSVKGKYCPQIIWKKGAEQLWI